VLELEVLVEVRGQGAVLVVREVLVPVELVLLVCVTEVEVTEVMVVVEKYDMFHHQGILCVLVEVYDVVLIVVALVDEVVVLELLVSVVVSVVVSHT